MQPKIITLVGTNASGKTSLAIELAKEFNGEVISADSRQVYRGLDVGSGKVTDEEMDDIPHHLLDVADPNDVFTVVDFKEQADAAIDDIIARENLPIIAGGTGFYIQAVVDNITPPIVPANEALRTRLEKLSSEKLLQQLIQLDPDRAATIEQNNPRRMIRAIEVATTLGKVPAITATLPKYDTLQIGIEWPKEQLRERINKRLIDRIENEGMIEEAEQLHARGLSYERMESLGLEYRYLARYLQKHITKERMIEELNNKIWQYAKRQKVWFKRDNRIHWLPGDDTSEAAILVRHFLDQ